LRVINLFITS